MENDKPKDGDPSILQEIKELQSKLLAHTETQTSNQTENQRVHKALKQAIENQDQIDELLESLDESKYIIEAYIKSSRESKERIAKLEEEVAKKDLIIRNLINKFKEFHDYKVNIQEMARNRLDELKKSQDYSNKQP